MRRPHASRLQRARIAVAFRSDAANQIGEPDPHCHSRGTSFASLHQLVERTALLGQLHQAFGAVPLVAQRARRRRGDVRVLPARDAKRNHRRFPSLRRLVVEDGARQRVADGIRAIDTIGQHEPARIFEDVLGIRQVQRLAVLEERQRLVADEAGERRRPGARDCPATRLRWRRAAATPDTRCGPMATDRCAAPDRRAAPSTHRAPRPSRTPRSSRAADDGVLRR